MLGLKNIPFILFCIVILSQVRAVEPKANSAVQVEGEKVAKEAIKYLWIGGKKKQVDWTLRVVTTRNPAPHQAYLSKWLLQKADHAKEEHIASNVAGMSHVYDIKASADGRYLAVRSIGEGARLLEVIDLSLLLEEKKYKVLQSINPFPGGVRIERWDGDKLIVSSGALLTHRGKDGRVRHPSLGLMSSQRYALSIESGQIEALSEGAKDPVAFFTKRLLSNHRGEREDAAVALKALNAKSAVEALKEAIERETHLGAKEFMQKTLDELEKASSTEKDEAVRSDVKRDWNWPTYRPKHPPTDPIFKDYAPQELIPYVTGEKRLKELDYKRKSDGCRLACAWFIWKTRSQPKLRKQLADAILLKLYCVSFRHDHHHLAQFLGFLEMPDHLTALLEDTKITDCCYGPDLMQGLAACGSIEYAPVLIRAFDKDTQGCIHPALVKMTGVQLSRQLSRDKTKQTWVAWWKETYPTKKIEPPSNKYRQLLAEDRIQMLRKLKQLIAAMEYRRVTKRKQSDDPNFPKFLPAKLKELVGLEYSPGKKITQKHLNSVHDLLPATDVGFDYLDRSPLMYDDSLRKSHGLIAVVYYNGRIDLIKPEELPSIDTTVNVSLRPGVKPTVQVEGEGWGKTVEGVQCRLRPDKTVWKIDETPTFSLDLHNRGSHTILYFPFTGMHCEVEWNGQWYWRKEPMVWDGPPRILNSGKEIENAFHIALSSKWRGRKDDKPLSFTPGNHTVRVRFSPDGRKVHAVSNPVKIEILPTD